MAEASAAEPRFEPVIDPATQPMKTLNTGAKMPQIALGTSELLDTGCIKKAVSVALQSGYRAIDTAWIYFTEEEVAAGIKDSGVPREQIFITTKLSSIHHKAADVEPACRDSLKKLGTEYIDLFLIHWPISFDPKTPPQGPIEEDSQIDVPIEETWKALEACVEKGLVRAIGLSNFKPSSIKHILSFAKVKPAVLQVEGHPWLQQRELKKLCDDEGIVIGAYMNLGNPTITEGYSLPQLMKDPTIVQIAEETGRSPADVLLRWPVQAGFAVPPKSVKAERIRSNLKACLNPLPESAMESIGKITTQFRYLDGAVVFPKSGVWTGDVPFKKTSDFWE